MALTRTTLSAAMALTDTLALLASITGLQVGMPLIIDREEMRITSVPSAATIPVGVTRGVNGTAAAAHAITSGAVFGPAGDFTIGTAARQAPRQRVVISYGAAGAIDIPTPGTDLTAIINGTSVLAMTVAVPGKANDGDRLTIASNGVAAHTVTFTGGLSGAGAGYTVVTFNASRPVALEVVAVNGLWQAICQPAMGGIVTNLIGSVA